jgi:hypothetical protein
MSNETAVTIVAEAHTKHFDRIATALESIAKALNSNSPHASINAIEQFVEKTVDHPEPLTQQEQEQFSKELKDYSMPKKNQPKLAVGDRIYSLHNSNADPQWRGQNGYVEEVDESRGEVRVVLDKDNIRAIYRLEDVVKSGSTNAKKT